jgi:putative oxidoreductase
LSRFEPAAYALLRVVAGAMFSLHGMQKLFGWFGSKAMPAVGSQMWFGGIIELVAGLLIAIGLLTRPAAFVASGMMAVAYIQFHWKLQMGNLAWVPLVNHGELAALYCFVFLFIAAAGAGIASVDGTRRGGRAR